MRKPSRKKLAEKTGQKKIEDLVAIGGGFIFSERGGRPAERDEYDRNPEAGSSWEEAKARVFAGLHAK
jgi:hypothetical protein